MKVSLSVAWEQVLDVSAGANIQHAATKVTDRDTFISWTLAVAPQALNELNHINL